MRRWVAGIISQGSGSRAGFARATEAGKLSAMDLPERYREIVCLLIEKAKGFLEAGEALSPIAFVGNFATGRVRLVAIHTGNEAAKDDSAQAIRRIERNPRLPPGEIAGTIADMPCAAPAVPIHPPRGGRRNRFAEKLLGPRLRSRTQLPAARIRQNPVLGIIPLPSRAGWR